MQGFCDGRVVGGGPPFGVYLHGRRAVLLLDAVQKSALCVGHGEKQAAQRLVLEGLVQPMDAEVRRGVVAQEGVGDRQQGDFQVTSGRFCKGFFFGFALFVLALFLYFCTDKSVRI